MIAQSTGFSLEEVNDLENLIRKEEKWMMRIDGVNRIRV